MPKTTYIVEYANLGRMTSPDWRTACKDMKHLIDNGYKGVTVRKEVK